MFRLQVLAIEPPPILIARCNLVTYATLLEVAMHISNILLFVATYKLNCSLACSCQGMM